MFRSLKIFALKALMGDLYELGLDPLGKLTKASHDQAITKYRITNSRAYVISNPEMIKELMLDQNKCYDKCTLANSVISRVVGKSLIVSSGELWRKQRQIAAPAFKAERIQELSSIFVDVAKECAQRWEEKSKNDESVDVGLEMMTTTLTSAIRTLFGMDVNNEDYSKIINDIPLVVYHLSNGISEGGLPFWIPTKAHREFRRSVKPVNKMMHKIINQKRFEANNSAGIQTRSTCLIDNLILATDIQTGKGLTDRELRDEVIGYFYAGHETTTVALTWIWIMLGQHAEHLREIKEEIRVAVGERIPSFGDIEHLGKLNCAVLEAMRLYPPIWLLDRRAITANMLQNLKVEKNDFIGLCIYALHRDPKYWNDPNDFVPTRFEGDWRKRIDRYAFMPFGAGPRSCIGLSFALIEIQLILAYLIPRFDIEIPEAGSIKPKPYLTLRTDRPVHMWVKRTKVPI